MRGRRVPLEDGFTIWITGLPLAGKSTVATLVAGHLREGGYKVEVLDEEAVETNLCKGLDPSKESLDICIRRIGFICQLLSRNGVVAIVAAISPYRAVREEVRQSIGRFVEVYVKCPREVCMERDVNGLYEGARRGGVENVPGVSDPYEEPLRPEVVCQTDAESPEQSAARVINRLVELKYLDETLAVGGEPPASPGYSPEEEEAVKARLRSLGYLE
jgi:adenylyl-sulfate kinase